MADLFEGIIDKAEAQDRRIADLERQLAEALALATWTPIDAEHLPKVGDELLHSDGSVKNFEPVNPETDVEWDAEDYEEWNWLWKRPVNAPCAAKEAR